MAGTQIILYFYFYSATTALADFYFGCSSTGTGGVGLRLDGRASQHSGFFASSAFNAGLAGGGVAQTITTTAWHEVLINVNTAGTRATWYLDGVLQQQDVVITLGGDYIGVYGDGGSNGADFAQITIAAIANQSSPILTLAGTYWNGSASATDSWTVQDVVDDSGDSTLVFTHTGFAGFDSVSMPGLISTGEAIATLLGLSGSTSGIATITPPAVAGTSTNPLTFSNVIVLPVGAVATPSFAFAGDLTTGFFDVSTGSPALSISGVISELFQAGGVMRMPSTGLLSWGTTTAAGTQDTGISRLSGASLAIGNGTAGDGTGGLLLASLAGYGTTATNKSIVLTAANASSNASAGSLIIVNTSAGNSLTLQNAASSPTAAIGF